MLVIETQRSLELIAIARVAAFFQDAPNAFPKDEGILIKVCRVELW